MKILTRADAARFLQEHDHFAILSHRRPDGDTVGSSAALCRGLRQLGKTAHVLENKEVTPRFAWLHEGLTKPRAEEGDTVVSVDVASPEMLPADFRPLLGKIALRIDHHSSATSFTEQELVDGDSASCAEVVWDVLSRPTGRWRRRCTWAFPRIPAASASPTPRRIPFPWQRFAPGQGREFMS